MTSTSHTSPVQLTGDAQSTRIAVSLGWAVFLAMSWTWCIGMFLPHLLIRDYGGLGWIVFAVPNIAGAAAMGWVMRSSEQSTGLVNAHRHACAVFSAVTIAFHFFFAVAVVTPLARSLNLGFGSVLIGSILCFVLMTRGVAAADLLLAGLVLVVSLAMMGLTIQQLPYSVSNLPTRLISNREPLADLVSLTPVCIFGFLFCPYLDLTFHRARRQSPSPRVSFGLGFGILFLAMIVFTLLYSDVFHGPIPSLLGIALFVHMAVQSAFTIAAHAREIRYAGVYAPGIAVGLSALAIAAHWLVQKDLIIQGREPGEIIYRVFMGFYGLVAPAYVWLVMCSKRLDATAPDPRNLRIFVVAVVLAAPFFWMGFVARHMIWLLPGLAVVLGARVLLTGRCANPRPS